MNMLIYFLYAALFLTAGCSEVRTSDPEEVYARWSNGRKPDGLELLEGEYWQSAHWSKEYVMYLKAKASKEWWAQYKQINGFEGHRIDEVDVSKSEIFRIDNPGWLEKPDWFKPDLRSEVYGQFGGSKYFWDAQDEIIFIYEIQL
jgi:hypothetical protein